jgi:hypothetical protein
LPYRDKKVVGVFVRFSCAASVGEEFLVRRLTIPDVVSDANLNTLVDCLMFSLRRWQLADTILRPIMWVAQLWSLIDIWKSDTFRTSSYANFAQRWFLLGGR